MATEQELLRFHTEDYVTEIRTLSDAHGGLAGPGTPFGAGSYEIAKLAAGGTIVATDAVLRGEVTNAYALVRPPGHHAERDLGRGFCIFANVALAAMHAKEVWGLERIATIDWDVHHGNGTQDICYNNENILFISTHQYPYYPGTGSEQERGKFNNIKNIPLPAGTNSEQYFDAFEHGLKKLEEFKPEFILISLGLDGHQADPLAQFNLKTEDYYTITKRILESSKKFCNGKVVSILEGGYDLKALQDSTKRHVDALIEFN